MSEEDTKPVSEIVLDIPLYPGVGADRENLLKRIAELKTADEQGAREIVADVVKAGLSDLAIETLMKH